MATLYKAAGRKTWQCIIYDPEKKKHVWRSTRTADKSQAQAVAATFEMAARRSVSRDMLHRTIDNLFGYDKPTMRIEVCKMAEVYAGLPDILMAKSTKQMRLRNSRRFVRWLDDHYPGIKYLDEIDRGVVVAFTDELRRTSQTAKTFNTVKGSLQAVFQGLLIRAGLTENPFKVIKAMAKTDSKTGRVFTPDEEQRILDGCKRHTCNQWYMVSMVARYTGLRLSSIKLLKWSEVFEDRIEHLPPKTIRHNIRIVVPLHSKLQVLFAGMTRGGDDDYVFDRVRRRNNCGKHKGDYTKILAAAGVRGDDRYVVSFHSWRHTWRTRLSASGADKDVVQAMGGWTSDISEKVYNQDFERFKTAIEGLT